MTDIEHIKILENILGAIIDVNDWFDISQLINDTVHLPDDWGYEWTYNNAIQEARQVLEKTES